jgi:hypothetical protein
MNKDAFKGIMCALKEGYTFACWSSGGRVPVAVILDKRKTIFSGEGGNIERAMLSLSDSYLRKTKNKLSQMTGSTEMCESETLNYLNRFIVNGSGYVQMNYESHSDIIITTLDGYNEEIDKVIRIGFGKNILESILKTFESQEIKND